MNYQEVLENAKIKMAPNCRVCKVCNGIVCKGEVPGVGGKGSGNGFTICNEFLSSIKLKMDTIYQNKGQDTSILLFGKTFKYPIFAAPIGGMKLNYNDAISEEEYSEAIVFGTIAAGCAGFTGDGPMDELLMIALG